MFLMTPCLPVKNCMTLRKHCNCVFVNWCHLVSINLYDSRSSRLWPARSLEMTQQIIVSSVINMTDIDTYSSQGCTPNQAPVWFDLVPSLSVPVPGSSLQASNSPPVTCSGIYFKMFFFVPVQLANNTSVPSFDIFFRHLQPL